MPDIPCSGEGTVRKDRHVLPLYTLKTTNELHRLQVRILVRAIPLVKVGGVVSYSTCSLNQLEDEAVVAEALLRVDAVDNRGIQIRGAKSSNAVIVPES